MLRIRAVQPADAPAWIAMRQDLWPDETGAHAVEVARFFDGTTPAGRYVTEQVLVAEAPDESADEVIGFAELTRRSIAEGCETSPVAFLEGWYVRPAYRQRGIGRALMAAAEAWGRAQGCREFASNADEDNAGSIAAHHALGFEDLGVTRSFRKML